MPSLRHAMFVAFGGDRKAVELAGKPHSVVANVDHLLDFAEAFGLDLAGLNGNEPAERALVGAKLFAKQPHEFRRAWEQGPDAIRGRPREPFRWQKSYRQHRPL